MMKTYSHLDVIRKRKIIRGYPWSSYSGYIDPRNRESFVKYSKVISMVVGKDDRKGRKRYKEFVIGRISEDMNITFWKEVKGQVVLGSEAFSNWIYDRFLLKRSDDGKEVPGLKALRPDLIRMEDIAREVANEFEVDSDELCRRRSKCRVARSVFMEFCRLYLTSKVGLTEIGRRLGGVSVDALSKNSRRLSEKMGDDPDLRQQFQKLAMVLDRLSK
jgi:hypothetical protein